MGNSNDRKTAFLGMPHGTANGRLRKAILFKYVCKAGDNFCHKCGSEIESVDDLSIEHKSPWEGRSVDLFWDLDNIAFSHLSCNKPHTHGAIKLRKIGPNGENWCNTCKKFKDVNDFTTRPKRWNGLDVRCKMCAAEKQAEYRKNMPL